LPGRQGKNGTVRGQMLFQGKGKKDERKSERTLTGPDQSKKGHYGGVEYGTD